MSDGKDLGSIRKRRFYLLSKGWNEKSLHEWNIYDSQLLMAILNNELMLLIVFFFMEVTYSNFNSYKKQQFTRKAYEWIIYLLMAADSFWRVRITLASAFGFTPVSISRTHIDSCSSVRPVPSRSLISDNSCMVWAVAPLEDMLSKFS